MWAQKYCALSTFLIGLAKHVRYIDASVYLICEDSVKPEFSMQNQSQGNSSRHFSYAPVQVQILLKNILKNILER